VVICFGLGEDFRQVDYIKFKLRVDLVGDYRSGEILFGESCRFVVGINGVVYGDNDSVLESLKVTPESRGDCSPSSKV